MSDKQFKNVAIEREDGITFVMLNRPEKRNAMSPDLHYDMDAALDWLAADKDTQVAGPRRRRRGLVRRTGPAALFPRHRKRSGRAPALQRREPFAGAGRSSRHSRKPTIAMVNGYCFGGAFTQLCACDFAITAEDATYGLSEVNWGIIPGGIVSWNLAQMMLPRHALFYAVTGDTFDGKRAVELGLANFAVPKAKLREETVKLRQQADEAQSGVVRYTKEAVRAVRDMNEDQARDYLRSKQDSLARNDKEIREKVGMKQFLDDKTYRPGLGPYQRTEA